MPNMTPDQFQTVALAWLAAISAVATGAAVIIAKNWTAIGNAIEAIHQLRARLNSHDETLKVDTKNLEPAIPVAGNISAQTQNPK